MAATASELQARLDALKKARDSGVLTIRQDNTSTTFRSLAEIERTIAALEGDIVALSSTSTRKRSLKAYQISKGL